MSPKSMRPALGKVSNTQIFTVVITLLFIALCLFVLFRWNKCTESFTTLSRKELLDRPGYEGEGEDDDITADIPSNIPK